MREWWIGMAVATVVAGGAAGCASRSELPAPPPASEVRKDANEGMAAPEEEHDAGIVGGIAGGVLGGTVADLAGSSRKAARQTASVALEPDAPWRYRGPMSTEEYARIDEEGFLDSRRDPLSTFSVDVDTASYANMRRFLNEGRLPPKDAVRIEELVNYFGYDYPEPKGGTPFAVHTEVGPCPWNEEHRLVLIGLQGRHIPAESLPPRNLVFLIDVSGSMQSPDKLPLLKSALRLLANNLTPRDSVAIAVYAGSSGLVLPRTRGDQRATILDALGQLEAGGSTNGGEGIELAYSAAQEGFAGGAVNRVILATDGDFNVGTTDLGALTRLIESKRESGIFLSVLGFGRGNLNDATMEALADRGNGNYAYIDSLQEARKVLVQEAGGTLVTIAKDVKLQVELNPARVGAYRLIGYENRRLRAEDFADDRKDAGEIGAGHRVTALYEIAPQGSSTATGEVPPLRYQSSREGEGRGTHTQEIMTVSLRYKEPAGDTSRLVSHVVTEPAPGQKAFSPRLTWAAAVSAFGMLLRDSEHKGRASYDQTLGLARQAASESRDPARLELVGLVELAQALATPTATITE